MTLWIVLSTFHLLVLVLFYVLVVIVMIIESLGGRNELQQIRVSELKIHSNQEYIIICPMNIYHNFNSMQLIHTLFV
jgi:hypothetical protein